MYEIAYGQSWMWVHTLVDTYARTRMHTHIHTHVSQEELGKEQQRSADLAHDQAALKEQLATMGAQLQECRGEVSAHDETVVYFCNSAFLEKEGVVMIMYKWCHEEGGRL
eukprot:1033713-Pelagomonas_calceolata.AAC.2